MRTEVPAQPQRRSSGAGRSRSEGAVGGRSGSGGGARPGGGGGNRAEGPVRPRPPIDPRLRNRWVEVRRQQGRRRLRLLVAVAALLGLAGAGTGVLYSPLLAVHAIEVRGAGAVPRSLILAAAGLTRPGPMIDVSTATAVRRLDALPDLGDAHLVRVWPTTVRIDVVARVPVARVPDGARWAVLDGTGRVLAVSADPLAGVPILAGVAAAPAPGQWLPGSAGSSAPPDRGVDMLLGKATLQGTAAALAVAASLPRAVRAATESITVGPHGDLRLLVTGMASATPVPQPIISVDLGGGSQLGAKVTALVTLLHDADLVGVSSVNLTVPSRPAALTASQPAGTVSTHAGG